MNFRISGECIGCHTKGFIANPSECYCIACYKEIVCPRRLPKPDYNLIFPKKRLCLKVPKRLPDTYSSTFMFPVMKDQDDPSFEDAVKLLETDK